jgi:hypothetical protein
LLLSQYIINTQDFLNDPTFQFYPLPSLTSWINRARARVAIDSQCVRIIPPSTGSFVSIAVTNGGSGYVSPTVNITYPDGVGGGFVQATAAATVVLGVITAINITNAGSGYISPVITITDGAGVGATTSFVLSPLLSTQQGQESYTFASVIPLLPTGAKEIYAVQSVSVSWGSMIPMLRRRAFSDFQAQFRAWNIGAQNFPEVFSQYSQGSTGSIYVYPIPANRNQMIWDTYCLPIDLIDDTTVDLISDPYTEAVSYYAAHLAYMNAQRRDDAGYMLQQYRARMIENADATQPAVVPNPYDVEAY